MTNQFFYFEKKNKKKNFSNSGIYGFLCVSYGDKVPGPSSSKGLEFMLFYDYFLIPFNDTIGNNNKRKINKYKKNGEKLGENLKI